MGHLCYSLANITLFFVKSLSGDATEFSTQSQSVIFWCARRPVSRRVVFGRIYRRVLTVEIYSQYARKNLDLLDQGPHGIVG